LETENDSCHGRGDLRPADSLERATGGAGHLRIKPAHKLRLDGIPIILCDGMCCIAETEQAGSAMFFVHVLLHGGYMPASKLAVSTHPG